MNNIKITPDEILQLNKNTECYLLDVRTPDEFAACHLPGAINMPLDKIEKGEINSLPRHRKIYLICQSGMRSDRAHKLLQSQGFQDLVCIEGGLAACEKISGAVVRLSSRIPLMRQVQIGAGSLVVLGVAFSKILSPYFLYLSLFAGAGLIFAGLTGFCGMALILEKMPWNKISGGGCENK